MRKIIKPLSVLLSLTLIFGMLTVIPTAQAAQSDVESVGDNTINYSYNAQSEELRLLSGDFSKNNKWGSDVPERLVKSVTAEEGVTFSGDCSELFTNFVRCKRIDLSKANTAAVTNMSQIFMYCESLKDLDISGFDISGVTNTNAMFLQALNLRTITLPANFSLVSGMMLYNGDDQSGWVVMGDHESGTVVSGTENWAVISVPNAVTTYIRKSACEKSYTYDSETKELRLNSGCFSAADKWGDEVDENFVKSVVAGDGVYFYGDCTSLFQEFYRCVSMDFSKVDTTAVTKMYLMFHYCHALETLDLSGFDVSGVTQEANSLAYLFTYTYSLSKLTLSPKMSITASMKLTNYQFIIEGDYENQTVVSGSGGVAVIPAPAVTTTYVRKSLYQPTYTFDSETGALTLNSGYFSNANKWGDDIEISSVQSVTADEGVFLVGDCSELFSYFYHCSSMDFSKVDTSLATDMKYFFLNDESLRTLDLSGFDISGITAENGLLGFFGSAIAQLQKLTLSPNISITYEMELHNNDWIVSSDFTKTVVSGTDFYAVIEAPKEITTYIWKVHFEDHPYFLNGVGYDSLQKAMKDADDGDTVYLTQDITESGNLNSASLSRDGVSSFDDVILVKLDFNGHTITNSNGGDLLYISGASLELCDSSAGEKGGIANAQWEESCIVIARYGRLTLSDGVKLVSQDSGSTINGYPLVQLNIGAELIINNAYIKTNAGYPIYFKDSTDYTRVEIIEGDINGAPDWKGGLFDSNRNTCNPTIIISGGSLTFNTFLEHGSGENISITGGTFSRDVSDYCADGYVCVKRGNDYKVVEEVYVAQVGDTKYLSFSDAADAADGADITLLADIEDEYTMTGAGTLRVIKDGYNLTVNPPEGDYIYTETTEDDVTVYKAVVPVAQVGDDLYGTFAEAVEAAGSEKSILLLTSIDEPYYMTSPDQTFWVLIKDGYSLTVNPPADDYVVIDEAGMPVLSPVIHHYSAAPAVAAVGEAKFASFSKAVKAADTGQMITLLRDVEDPYTMEIGDSINVVMGEFSLTVYAPENYILIEDEKEAQGDDPAYTTFSSVKAVAKVGDDLYETFEDAVEGADGADITLLDDIADAYTMTGAGDIRVNKGTYELTVNPPEGDYIYTESTKDNVTVYSAVAAVAKVGDTLYAAFDEAVAAANGNKIILLADIEALYTMTLGQSFDVIKGEFSIKQLVAEGNNNAVVEEKTAAQGEEPAYSTFTCVNAVASVNGVMYGTFADAVDAAKGEKITLLTNITNEYTMSVGQVFSVIKGAFTLDIIPPDGEHAISESVTEAQGETPEFSTFSVVTAVARIDNKTFGSFGEAVSAASDTQIITLLANIGAYTLPADKGINVNKNGFTIDVKAPEGPYVLHQQTYPVTETVPAYTHYYLNGAVALANGKYFEAFADAVTYANGQVITLFADVSSYTLSSGSILVKKNGHSIYVNASEESGVIQESTDSTTGVTTYTFATYVAKVGETLYATFEGAVNASAGSVITLLADMTETYHMSDDDEIKLIKVRPNGFDVLIDGNSGHYQEDGGAVEVFIKEPTGGGGGGFVLGKWLPIGAAIGAAIAGGSALYLSGNTSAATAGVSLALGQTLTIEGEGELVDLEPQDPENQAIQEEENQDGSRTFKNVECITIIYDLGISFSGKLDELEGEISGVIEDNLPEEFKYIPSFSTDPIASASFKIRIPWPKGAPIFAVPLWSWGSYINSGHTFLCWYVDAGVFQDIPVPYIFGSGRETDLTLDAYWVDDEAEVNGTSCTLFSLRINDSNWLKWLDTIGVITGAVENADGQVITLKSDALFPFTLRADETLNVKLDGHNPKISAPAGYDLHVETHEDTGITTYMASHKYTATLDYQYNNKVDTLTVWYGEKLDKPADPERPGWYIDYWYYIDTTKPEGQQNVRYNFSNTISGSITLYAHWAQEPVYNITVGETSHGTVSVDKQSTFEGDTVTLTVNPDDGYAVKSVKFNGTDAEFQNGVYSFTMPNEAVTVTAEYQFSDGIGASVAGHSISLDGDIAVNFYMELDPAIAQSKTAYMHFTISDTSKEYQEQKVLVSEAEEKGDYYVFKCRVAAKNMTSVITAQILDEGKQGTPYTYSVSEYANWLLNHKNDNEQYTKAAPLVEKMLQYGTYAKEYFDMTNILDDLGEVSINAPDTEFDLPEGVTFEGATLSLKSQTTLSLYFTSNDKLTFTCVDKDGYDRTVEYAKNGSYQVARIRNIAAKELQDSFTLTVTAGESSGTAIYSPMNYCKNVLTSSSATPDEAQTTDTRLINVAKALYQYSYEAYEYFKPNQEGN